VDPLKDIGLRHVPLKPGEALPKGIYCAYKITDERLLDQFKEVLVLDPDDGTHQTLIHLLKIRDIQEGYESKRPDAHFYNAASYSRSMLSSSADKFVSNLVSTFENLSGWGEIVRTRFGETYQPRAMYPYPELDYHYAFNRRNRTAYCSLSSGIPSVHQLFVDVLRDRPKCLLLGGGAGYIDSAFVLVDVILCFRRHGIKVKLGAPAFSAGVLAALCCNLKGRYFVHEFWNAAAKQWFHHKDKITEGEDFEKVFVKTKFSSTPEQLHWAIVRSRMLERGVKRKTIDDLFLAVVGNNGYFTEFFT
jgi:hypothetical protein